MCVSGLGSSRSTFSLLLPAPSLGAPAYISGCTYVLAFVKPVLYSVVLSVLGGFLVRVLLRLTSLRGVLP